jgi:UDPglucose 6-dehydrogenase
VDNDPAKYAALARGKCPIHEEHLPELLARHRGKRLVFSDSLSAAVQASRAVFIAVGTPPTHDGEADLSYVDLVAREIAGALNDYKVIVGKSTVPVYTSDWVRRVMVLNGAPADLFDVASNPEFLREGTAVTDFLYPDRMSSARIRPPAPTWYERFTSRCSTAATTGGQTQLRIQDALPSRHP